MLTYLEIARRLRPRWVVWENVPGVLSSNGGRDFGSFLGAMGLLGYGVAYRVLDAQWMRTQRHPCAVPQRRRRVFVVGCLGDWERAAQVLFERESVQRDSAPRRTQREGAAANVEGSIGAGRWWDGTDCAGTLTKQNAGGGQRMPDKDNLGAVLQPVGYRWQNDRDGLVQDGIAPACRASTGSSGFHEMNHPVVINTAMTVRRLTPSECERLQGFPDDYTLIPWRKKAATDCPDGPRYKALGNSMAVNCMAWIGERIAAVDAEMGTKE